MTTNSPTDETQITFAHPRSAKKLRVGIGPSITGKAALEQLQQRKDFFPTGEAMKSASLVCERTKEVLPMNSSLVAAGLQNGDVVVVNEIKEGHAPEVAP